ncbi:MAG TPA: hypothetical protein VMT39_02905, partial [Candidatus Bathyarchaeia archaeon]|nr:hypothetical protein [Candidatus Bathyarchaeia archaeon]
MKTSNFTGEEGASATDYSQSSKIIHSSLLSLFITLPMQAPDAFNASGGSMRRIVLSLLLCSCALAQSPTAS